MTGEVELRVEVMPASPFRLPRLLGKDGVTRRRGGVIERLLHDADGEPVAVRVAQCAPDAVIFGARAKRRASAEHGIARMRFALGVDDDLREFYRQFASDPLIGRSVRTRPWLRARRRPEPFEALVYAMCEQLIEYDRAAAIQRRIVARWGRGFEGDGGGGGGGHTDGDGRDGGGDGGRSGDGGRGGSQDRCGDSGDGRRGGSVHGRRGEGRGGDGETGMRRWADGLRDLPTPARLGGAGPAKLQACDLGESRAIALTRAAREVAGGRVDLDDARPERGWRALRTIPGIGAWTVEMLALCGQGRYDQLPAGDLGLLKLAGRILSGGDTRARAGEEQVRELFAPYGRWAGLAAVHAAGI